MKKIYLSEMEEDMILAKDILGPYDQLLIARGTRLSENVTDKIKELGVRYIYVIADFHKEESQDDYKKRIKEERQLKEKYADSLNKFKDVYNEVQLGKKIETKIVEESVNGLVENVVLNNNVLKRLRETHVVDDYTYTHSINVCVLATMIGKWLNYSQEKLDKLAMAAFLHDIGKAKIKKEILNKPGRLTREECSEMKRHAEYGYKLVQNDDKLDFNICCGILQHHERFDGSGYPYGLKSERIHEFARIIAIADVFDAMTSERSYKDKESPFKVAEEIENEAYDKLDPYICNIFLWNISKFYVGNIVKLSDGKIGEIVLVNKQRPTRPLIKVGENFVDLLKTSDVKIVEVIG
ncbi:MAG: HD-GYP domain-containing protein [Anaeromicrobium sp.]|jgi:HD-GYP domain-containing protein (c-di-GMP phosphodiesterase class II)|uniref:HD-GYP domain-containing protein n=1 Tax=Anaeromicrobium sp. TaxID=1929132 RepID=UPI0025F3C729|nr:HD-GYP domain-containing protein [Anaeromicrobium sp.]MCT4593982.1 HD-GYP domain-containing protein [Anaeromicrobium sp.]